MSTYSNVDKYIQKVILDACRAEGRDNDVSYKFCIMEDNVVMSLSTHYLKVRRRIEYRLKNNLPKNFRLKYNEDFDINANSEEAGGPIDVNYSVERFSETPFATIRAFGKKKHLLPPYVRDGVCGIEFPSKNCEEFYKRNNGKPPKTWEKYLEDYKSIYGKPLQSIAVWE